MWCTALAFASILSGILPAQEVKKSGRYFTATLTQNFTVGKGGTLTVQDIRGDVVIESWEKGEVFIREFKRMDVYTKKEAQTIVEKAKSSYRQRGDNIDIHGERYQRDWIESRLEIKVPRVYNVNVHTNGGDIEVGGLTGRVELRTSGGDIELRDIDGTVEAVTSGGDIFVMAVTQAVTIKTSGGEIRLQDVRGDVIGRTSGGDIVVRGTTGSVELKTSGGDIRIRDVAGKVAAHTSGGDIEVMGAEQDIEVSTSGGDIELNRLRGSVEASTSGGDIEANAVSGYARLYTSGGDIEVRRLTNGIQAKTAGGDISVEMTLTDFSRDHGVEMRTAGGQLELAIPNRMPATILAEIKVSSRWQDYNIYSDFPLTSTDDTGRGERSRGRYLRSEGDINGGGDRIELYTADGDIYIKKLK